MSEIFESKVFWGTLLISIGIYLLVQDIVENELQARGIGRAIPIGEI